MGPLRVRGIALPDAEPVDLYADGDRWTTDPVAGAELVAEGWLLPGLVDMHTHPGAERPGQPLSEDVLREDLRRQVEAGVTLLRAPGLAGDPPAWFGQDEELPRSVHAGRWLVQKGQFFDGWGRRPDPAELPAVAAGQARRTGWAKVIGDWGPDSAIPLGVLTDVVAAVHKVGGRLAVHAMTPESAAAAVAAGVDTLEHGLWLDPGLLATMAERGIALTPTLSVMEADIEHVQRMPDGPRKDWLLGGVAVHPALAARAAEAGVRLLAGTDSRPHGRIAVEIRAMVAAGVPVDVALGAASWQARSYLGYPGLVDGGPADAVVYAEDPRTDPGQLEHPLAVILRGRVRRPG